MNFILKSLIKRQLKNVPEEQIDMLIAVVEKNPSFFKMIADEINERTKTGMSQQDAAMEIMKKHEAELRSIMGQPK